MTDDSSCRAVARRLQTGFRSIEKLYFDRWMTAVHQGLVPITELQSISERYQGAGEASDEGFPLCKETDDQPEEEDRRDMSKQLEILKDKMSAMSEVQRTTEKHFEESLDLYARLLRPDETEINPTAVVVSQRPPDETDRQKTAVNVGSYRPIIEDLLKKLDWIDTQICHSYEERRWFMNAVVLEDPVSIDRLTSAWQRKTESRQIRKIIAEANLVLDEILNSADSSDET